MIRRVDPQATGRENMIDVLGVDIGPRVAGSVEAFAAADSVALAMEAIGLSVTMQEFEFVGYAAEEPLLVVDGDRWAAAPCLYARAADVEGVIRFLGVFDDGVAGFPVFVLVGDDGAELAWLYAAPFDAGAVPLASLRGPTLTGVAAIISSADGRRLRDIGEARARLRTRGRLVEGLRERNVIGALGGVGDEYVVVSSHFDSVWRGPGVLDNATGVEGMLRVVESLSGSRRRRGVMACAFACEEIGLLGSRFFVTEAMIRGSMDRIVGVVNLDAIAHGEALEISVSPRALERRVLRCAGELGVSDRYPIVVRVPLPDADDYYFAQQGVPTASFVHFPYPEYHSTAERIELVDPVRFEDTVRLATRVAGDMLSSPIQTKRRSQSAPKRG